MQRSMYKCTFLLLTANFTGSTDTSLFDVHATGNWELPLVSRNRLNRRWFRYGNYLVLPVRFVETLRR